MTCRRRVASSFAALAFTIVTATAAGAPAQRIATPIGPDGGEIAWVTVHPHLTLAVGGFGGPPIFPEELSSVWASTDREQTWHRASARERASLALPPTDDRQCDPAHPNVVYRFRPFTGMTILEASTNGGRTFSVRSRRALRDLSTVKLLVVRSGKRTVLLVGAAFGGVDGERLTGIRRSLDGGYTWTTIAGTAGRVTGMWRAPRGRRDLYAAVEDNLVFTASGDTPGWRPGTRILRSRDGGRSWMQMGTRVPSGFGTGDVELNLSAHNPSRLLFSTGDSIFRSGDGGTTWTRVLRATVSRIVSHPTRPGHVVAASDTGIWTTDDGGRIWARANTGLKATWAEQLIPTGSQGRVYALGSFDVPRLAVSDNRGASWTMRRQTVTSTVVADPAAADTLVGVGSEGLARTIDAGRRWGTIAKNLEAPLAVDVTTRRLYATEPAGQRLVYSDDFGDHWTADSRLPVVTTLLAEGGVVYAANGFKGNTVWRRNGSGGWTQGAPFGGAVLDLVVAPSRPSTLYATSFSRKVRFGIAFGKSLDGGATWQLISMGNTPSTPGIMGLAVDRSNSQRVFAGRFNGGLWSSKDGGLSWSKTANIPGFITEIVQHPTQPNLLYVATMNDGAWRVELPS